MKKTLLILLALFGLSRLLAQPVEMAEARKVAHAFMHQHLGNEIKLTSESSYYTKGVNGGSCVHFFQFCDSAFVITGGDKRMKPIIGYGLNGGQEITTVRVEPLQMLIDNHLSEIASFGFFTENEKQYQDEWNDLASSKSNLNCSTGSYMLQTQWNQTSPYNNQAPTCMTRPPLAGCVSIALSQVMKYFNYPRTGTGSMSYRSGCFGSISRTFSSALYDYNAMPNTLNSSSSAAALSHTGKLIADVGIACQTQYSFNTWGIIGNGSSADVTEAVTALKNNFGYDARMVVYNPNNSMNQFIAALAGEVSTKPVCYYGKNQSSGGHIWVIDGVNSCQYFHCNWGWGGSQNAYLSMGDITQRYGSYNLYVVMTPKVQTAPTNVQATNGTLTTGVSVTWNANANNPWYRVFRSTSNSNTNMVAVSGWQTSTSYLDASAVSGTTYYYAVKTAANIRGEFASGFSSRNDGWRGQSCGTPSLSVMNISRTSCTLSWNAISGATRYEIYRSSTSTGTYSLLATTSATSQNLISMTAGANYCFKVRAICNSTIGAYSTSKCITTLKSMSVGEAGEVTEPTLEQGAMAKLVVFPNPGDGQTLSIKLDEAEEGVYSLRISNAEGASIYEASEIVLGADSLHPTQVQLQKGIYFLRLSSKNGSRSYTAKYIVN